MRPDDSKQQTLEEAQAVIDIALRRSSELTADVDDDGVCGLVNYMTVTAEWLITNLTEGFAYRNYYDMVLDLSTGVRRAPLELPSWVEPGIPQYCFANAHMLSTTVDGLTYVEGYAMHQLIPVHHAWCEDQEGRIIDPTWTHLDRGPDTAVYMGVRITPAFLLAQTIKTNWHSIIAGDIETDNAILKYGLVLDSTGAAIAQKERS